MSDPGRPAVGAADPIDAHVADLAAALHGPARAKSRMVTELREGLVDAARDLASGPDPDHDAARLAVREFGSVAEIAPSFQRELTIAQARHTARTVMLIAPLLLVCWYLVRTWDGATGRQLPDTVELLVAHLGGVAAVAALLAAAALAATGALARRLPTPHRLPLAVAWTGTVAATALAVSALTLTLASLLAANWPLSVAAGVVIITCHAKVAASARACRECARLPVVTP
ncbi:permease prefix domain 1-containing protein [Streptomyces boluensis]|uniref:Uncharacterized protein n=1 Tax=Streptomyces boluensis TaxID=1775135 RepID=A0A964XKC0_9ACTN|nr:permease prefix domain 1-containing protein [Streptomyces boluensis]NBE50931.1 hypothetical protein [Streptomyces boluensis]